MIFLKRRFWFWTLTVLTLVVILAAARLLKISTELPIHGKIPEFKLISSSGGEVTRQDLQNKIWIADFIFTRCAGICPMMTSRMKMIQEKFKNHPDILLVSFSVDPEYDTPEKLAAYAARFGADPQKWLFLTGDKAQIHQLSQQHFYLGVTDIPEAEREAPDQTVEHSSKFVLVDHLGQIRGYYASEELGFLDQLVKGVNGLLDTSRA